MVNLKIGSISGHLFFPFGKAGGRKIRRCQGLAVYYGCTLGALALKPSGFCNIGVKVFSEVDLLARILLLSGIRPAPMLLVSRAGIHSHPRKKNMSKTG
jgi:hypothetical protein